MTIQHKTFVINSVVSGFLVSMAALYAIANTDVEAKGITDIVLAMAGRLPTTDGKTTKPASADHKFKDSDQQGMDYVNIKDFSHLVSNDDWSDAIQAAIDHVSVSNGYEKGATIIFPPGIYNISKTLVLGKNRAHHSMRLTGYGAILVGTKTLDEQSVNYAEREKIFKDASATNESAKFNFLALPGELDFEGANVGPAILELWCPPREGVAFSLYEGASYVLEGLTFDREKTFAGVGVKIPAETVPKNVTFRDINVHRQNVGIHINHCYQIRFESCLFRGNKIGVWGRNHFNSVSILNSTFRRNTHHGMVIGPNAGQWGSSAIFIAGSIFESNAGYGILNAGGCQVTIIGNYFECNGNAIGVLTPYAHTAIEMNHIVNSSYPDPGTTNRIGDVVVSGKAAIVVRSTDVRLRANKYYCSKTVPILVFGLGGKNIFDCVPTVVEGIKLPDGMMAGSDCGTGAYVYDAGKGAFELRKFLIHTERETRLTRQDKVQDEVAEKERGQKYRCLVCLQVYDPALGDPERNVAAGTAFDALPKTWVCPACGASQDKFGIVKD